MDKPPVSPKDHDLYLPLNCLRGRLGSMETFSWGAPPRIRMRVVRLAVLRGMLSHREELPRLSTLCSEQLKVDTLLEKQLVWEMELLEDSQEYFRSTLPVVQALSKVNVTSSASWTSLLMKLFRGAFIVTVLE
jgi:hypothetical protein